MPHGEIARIEAALEPVLAERNICMALAVDAAMMRINKGENSQAFKSWLLEMKRSSKPDKNINRRAIAALNALLPEGK